MPDVFLTMRRGERRPVYGQVTLITGTLTIAPAPVPSITLMDANGSPVAGIGTMAATGYDTGAQTAPRLWFLLDTASLNAGFYTLTFQFTATASDGTSRVYMPCIEVQVVEG